MNFFIIKKIHTHTFFLCVCEKNIFKKIIIFYLVQVRFQGSEKFTKSISNILKKYNANMHEIIKMCETLKNKVKLMYSFQERL